ncbi:MAG: hypothetical protein KDB32_01065 [Planctomycetes bacterium]|nr:hypothetical protein [Planctomycetota bacterium]
MSCLAAHFLTVVFLLSSFAGALNAQRAIVKRELNDLAAPAAWQRASAINRLVSIEDDIDADLRVAWKIVDDEERIGLLQVARLRGSDALLQDATVSLGANDETLEGVAKDYLLTLPFELLTPDTAELTETQLNDWTEFRSFRIRRDISRVLLEAQMKPGKFFGQFDPLREFDDERLNNELLKLIRAESEYAEALNLASTEITGQDAASGMSLNANWRKMQLSTGAFEPALLYLNTMESTKRFDAGVQRYGRESILSALEIANGVRTAAIRALAQSDGSPYLASELGKCYETLLSQSPSGEFSSSAALGDLREEIELTLAIFGDDRLLQARISALRAQIEQVEDVRSNVNISASSRPDLIVQNRIAHLKLRSGDFKGAELEWSAGVETALAMLRGSNGRNRSSLSSYLATVYYNLACTQSLQLKHTKSLHSLKEAVRYGYKDFSWMLEDGDLESVRRFERFDEWFEDTAPPSVADRLHDNS